MLRFDKCPLSLASAQRFRALVSDSLQQWIGKETEVDWNRQLRHRVSIQDSIITAKHVVAMHMCISCHNRQERGLHGAHAQNYLGEAGTLNGTASDLIGTT